MNHCALTNVSRGTATCRKDHKLVSSTVAPNQEKIEECSNRDHWPTLAVLEKVLSETPP